MPIPKISNNQSMTTEWFVMEKAQEAVVCLHSYGFSRPSSGTFLSAMASGTLIKSDKTLAVLTCKHAASRMSDLVCHGKVVAIFSNRVLNHPSVDAVLMIVDPYLPDYQFLWDKAILVKCVDPFYKVCLREPVYIFGYPRTNVTNINSVITVGLTRLATTARAHSRIRSKIRFMNFKWPEKTVPFGISGGPVIALDIVKHKKPMFFTIEAKIIGINHSYKLPNQFCTQMDLWAQWVRNEMI